ncbi:MAG: YigZ family protein [Bacteroidetes bacterium]|nr:YigZ family protein [Bacteroidota bacterium]
MMLFSDTYRTLTERTTGIYREKASKFIGIAMPCTSEEEVKELLKAIKKEYFDASHHCYAYQLGFDKSVYRVNDDGEPSGTAGKPIFGQIQSFDLTNALVLVIRYFGGTKLGVSGLINAYRTASREALSQATIVERMVMDHYRLTFTYGMLNEVMKFAKEKHLGILTSDFNLECILDFSVRRRDSEQIQSALKKKQGIEIRYLGSF